MKLSDEQRIAVESKEKQIIVVSSAGSGKTRVLTERLKWLLDNGEDPSQIFAITFTNMAAEEMKQRIGDKSNGCYIGTIHGLANYILLRNGVDTSKVIDEENFDQMFEMIIDNHCKIPKVNHLLVDEFQDTGENEYNFLMFTLRPDHYFLIGDTRQKIYGFKTGPHDFFQEQIENPFTQVYELVDNYRSHYEIIRFGGDMIKKVKNLYRTPTRCVKGPGGQVIQEEFSWSTLLKYLGKYPNYKDWFILCRTNQQVDNVLSFLKTVDIPAITFRKSEKTLNEIKEDLDAAAVKVLTIHQSKGLESKYVMVYGAKFYNDEERRIDYVAATRAEELLIWFEGNDRSVSRKRKDIKQKTMMVMEDWG